MKLQSIIDIGRTNMEEKISIKRENVLTAYEHASEEQKALLENMFGKEMFQPKEIFTELKEGNERIRRWIIDDIRYNINNEPLNNSEYKKKAEKAIAWLEKQGEEYKVSSDKPAWRPSTEHPHVDEEVIVLIGEYNQIGFAHIVDKDICVDFDGWNIPEVKCWIPCPKIEED